jgi:hypothetical protein
MGEFQPCTGSHSSSCKLKPELRDRLAPVCRFAAIYKAAFRWVYLPNFFKKEAPVNQQLSVHFGMCTSREADGSSSATCISAPARQTGRHAE